MTMEFNFTIHTSEESNIKNTLTKESIEKEKRWQIISKFKSSLNELIKNNNDNDDLQELQARFNKIMELKDKLDRQNQTLKTQKIISLQERNAYLQKLYDLEDYGDQYSWEDNNNYLKEIQNLLFDQG